MSAIDRIYEEETSTREEQLRAQLWDAVDRQRDLEHQRNLSWVAFALVTIAFLGLVLERGEGERRAVVAERLDVVAACVARTADIRRELTACRAGGGR